MQQQIKEREYIALDQKIKEAKERQANGEPGADVLLQQLEKQRANMQKEIRQASNKEYVREHNEKKQKKKTLQKIIECEL